MIADARLLAILKQVREKTVDYTVNGKCSGCGECCSNTLPLTLREIRNIRRYVRRNGIAPITHFVPTAEPSADATCPFRDNENRKCTIYEARPLICRTFQCDKFKRGETLDPDVFGELDDYLPVDMRQTFFDN